MLRWRWVVAVVSSVVITSALMAAWVSKSVEYAGNAASVLGAWGTVVVLILWARQTSDGGPAPTAEQLAAAEEDWPASFSRCGPGRQRCDSWPIHGLWTSAGWTAHACSLTIVRWSERRSTAVRTTHPRGVRQLGGPGGRLRRGMCRRPRSSARPRRPEHAAVVGEVADDPFEVTSGVPWGAAAVRKTAALPLWPVRSRSGCTGQVGRAVDQLRQPVPLVHPVPLPPAGGRAGPRVVRGAADPRGLRVSMRWMTGASSTPSALTASTGARPPAPPTTCSRTAGHARLRTRTAGRPAELVVAQIQTRRATQVGDQPLVDVRDWRGLPHRVG